MSKRSSLGLIEEWFEGGRLFLGRWTVSYSCDGIGLDAVLRQTYMRILQGLPTELGPRTRGSST
jgi:hypothetical protein